MCQMQKTDNDCDERILKVLDKSSMLEIPPDRTHYLKPFLDAGLNRSVTSGSVNN